MRLLNSSSVPLALSFLVAAFTSGLTGCSAEFCDIVECAGGQGGGQGGSGGSGSTTSTGEGGTIDPGCIPSMLPAGASVPPECGIFVDANASAVQDGTQAAPVAELDDGLAIAADPGKPNVVYVCGSPELSGSFTMDGGISLFGGLACGTWTYDPSASQPKIVGVPGVPALEVAGPGSSLIEDFSIEAAPGMTLGQSSIGIFIQDANVSLARTSVFARDAANGEDGDPAMGGGGQGADGADSTCPGVSGAINMTYACDGTNTTGGNGGDPGVDGAVGQNNTTGGEGGTAASPDGEVGDPGANGNGGGPLPVDSFGTLSITGFTPSVAENGSPGLPGGGGGGGLGDNVGQPCGGGAGGAGGCGGPGGGGGQSGGASIAIAVMGGKLVIASGVRLTSGDGGSGGSGVMGEMGQTGGDGGTSAEGGDGGPGGPGGPGGAGAGGNGGLSTLVFLQDSMLEGMPAEKAIGMGGAPGSGGGGDAASGNVGLSCWLFTIEGGGPSGTCTP